MLSLNSIILILFLILSRKSCDAKYYDPPIDVEDAIVFQKYAEMDKQFKDIASYGLKRAMPMLMEASDRLNLSAKCVGNIFQLTTGLRKLKISAINCKFFAFSLVFFILYGQIVVLFSTLLF